MEILLLLLLMMIFELEARDAGTETYFFCAVCSVERY